MAMDGQWMANAGREDKYQYNGKEFNDDFGLNWYDYGARWYMPDIGRWGQIDPMAEKYVAISPYGYVANNPLILIDPDGMQIDISKLSDEEKEEYNELIKRLNTNELFNAYYEELEKSETVYTIKFGGGEGGSGSFNAETNEISFNTDV